MLPFLKNKDDGVGSGPVETKERKPDEPKDFGILDAVWADLKTSLEKDDAKLGRGALESLCDYLKQEDEEQDQQMMGD